MSGDTMPEFVEALVLRPGDKLIVRIDNAIDRANAAELRGALMKRLPELADVIVVGASGLAVLRNDVELAS